MVCISLVGRLQIIDKMTFLRFIKLPKVLAMNCLIAISRPSIGKEIDHNCDNLLVRVNVGLQIIIYIVLSVLLFYCLKFILGISMADARTKVADLVIKGRYLQDVWT